MEKGQHLLFEGVSQRLLGMADLQGFLVECPRTLKMLVIVPAQIVKTEGGWAGMTVIAESHVSVHTQGLEVYGDVFSCRPFASHTIVELAHALLLLETKPKPRLTEIRRGWSIVPPRA